MKRIATLLAALLLGAVALQAQNTEPVPVKVSSDRVRVGDKIYFAHVVTPRQTLYSIGKAYGVSTLDIIDSNPKLDLHNKPIHPGDVLLIPVRITLKEEPAAPADTVAAPADTVAVPVDSLAVPADTVAAPKLPVSTPNEGAEGESAANPAISTPNEGAEGESAPNPAISAPNEGAEDESAPNPAISTPNEGAEGESAANPAISTPIDTLKAEGDTLPAPADTVVAPFVPTRPPFIYDYADKIHVSLLLPFAADGEANAHYLNFYFGALLATRDLAAKGIDLDLTVIDVSSAKDFKRAGKAVAASDVIIGPVSPADIRRTLDLLPEGKSIVSPMDPKTEALTVDHPVILAATPARTQIEDAMGWMKSNMDPRDSLIVVKEAGYPMTYNAQYLIDRAEPENTGGSIRVSYALSEGIKMNEYFAVHTHLKDTVTWVIAASEHDVFVKDVIRNVALQNYMGHNVYIYGPAKTKSPDMDEMCGARLHQSATYYTDYNDSAVIRFVSDFRALFQTEPDNFAFHGYDTMMYFVSACDTYGRNWSQKLDEIQMSGLQTNFKFWWDPDRKGYVNSGIRRVIYSPGFKATLIK